MKAASASIAMNAQQDELTFDKINALFNEEFKTPFLPQSGFYDNWDPSDERLNLMKEEILRWLKIDSSSLPIKYTKGLKVPGVYTWQGDKSAILINQKYRKNPFEVGAILAHECMHHYMRNHNLESADVKTNELKTDLATICSGLGIPIINGMTYRSHWYLTIILLFLGRLYINERKRSFGYFKAPEYCKLFNQYLRLKGLGGSDVIGFIHPLARSFLPKDIAREKPKQESGTVKLQTAKVRKKFAFQVVAVIVVVGLILMGYRAEHKKDLQVKLTLQDKKKVIDELDLKLKHAQAELDKIKKDMEFYKTINDADNYNKLATSYKTLSQEGQQDYKKYVLLIKDYNDRVTETNRRRGR